MSDRQDRRERFVLEWQGPVYNYVRRMLRDDAEAADVTQEVFVRALRHLDRISSREIKPWLFRVARNAVCNHLRDSKLRRVKESRVPMASRPAEGRDPLEKSETEAALQEQLEQLPEEKRSLVVLHYFNGLSQREIASCLSMPRSKVAAQLQTALESLRERLRVRGHVVMVPQIESWMRASPPLEIPQSLSSSLLGLASSGGTGVGVSLGAGMGGVIVSKKIFIGSVLVSLVTFAAGLGVGGGVSARRNLASRDDTDRELVSLREESADLRRQNDELSDAIRLLRKEGEGLTRSLDAMKAERVATAKPAPPPGEGDAVKEPGTIDWERLARIVAQNRDVAFAIADSIASGSGPRSLSPEIQAAHRALVAELERAATEALLIAPYPMIDAELFPQIMQLYVAELLDLSDNQASDLDRLAQSLIDEFPLPDDATPLRAHAIRKAVLSRLQNDVSGLLDDEQREQWNRLDPLWSEIVSGNRRHVTFGLKTSDVPGRIVEEWRGHYRLSAEQTEALTPLAVRYQDAARNLLAEYGQAGGQKSNLGPGDRDRLNTSLYELQLRFEDELLSELTDEQRRSLHTQRPVYVHFGDHRSISISDSDNAGF